MHDGLWVVDGLFCTNMKPVPYQTCVWTHAPTNDGGVLEALNKPT